MLKDFSGDPNNFLGSALLLRNEEKEEDEEVNIDWVDDVLADERAGGDAGSNAMAEDDAEKAFFLVVKRLDI